MYKDLEKQKEYCRKWRSRNKSHIKKYRDGRVYNYNRYKCAAIKRNLIFSLTYEQFCNIVSLKCHYCNCFSEGHEYCGIDRKDNSIGYTIFNCLPCCAMCNKMKLAHSYDNFILKCVQIANQYKNLCIKT